MKRNPFRRWFLALMMGMGLIAFQPFTDRVRGTTIGSQTHQATLKPGTVLVKFETDVAAASATALMTRYGATLERRLNTGVLVLRVPEGREQVVSRALMADPNILFAEPDLLWKAVAAVKTAPRSTEPPIRLSEPEAFPSDPYYGWQWAHARIGSGAAWDLTTGDTDITIAIIDTGIDPGHPDLAAKIVPGHTFLEQGTYQDDNPIDENGHGTHVAGVAAAITDNGTGVAGMSWGARIMPVRVLGRDGTGWTSDIASGITWAVQNGADVINLSLGSKVDAWTVRDAVEDAHNAGALLVAALGNDGTDAPFYPAAYPDTIAVSATDYNDNLAYYSNYGPACDIAAPGGELFTGNFTYGIYSTLPTHDSFYLHTEYGYLPAYDYLQGPSQATPFVAGLAALIGSIDDTLTQDEIQRAIEETAVDVGVLGWDVQFGHGRIDARAALDLVNIPDAPVLTTITNPTKDGSYLIDWSDVDRVTAYVLEEDDHEGFSSPKIIASTTNSSFGVTNQLPGFWYYRVRALNASGTSGWSNAVSTGVVPAAPTLNGIETLGADAYRLSWTSAYGAQAYRLVEANNPTLIGAVTRYLGTSRAYTVTGQPSGTWYYRVDAGGTAGYSDPSNVISATASADPVPTPVLTSIDNDDQDGDYEVSWREVPTATTYILEESPRPYFVAPVAVYQGGQLTYTVTAQPIGRWHYRVRAVTTTDQKSPWSATQSVLVPDFVYLPLVTR
jgi:subtilisin family serine protease